MIETLDNGHGRVETPRYVLVGELDGSTRWVCRSVCEGWRRSLASNRNDTSVTRLRQTPVLSSAHCWRTRHASFTVRTHWGVENGVHWCLNVTFGEDASAIRLCNAAHNFSFLHRHTPNLFRADTSRNISLPRKCKTAAWNPVYLAYVLGLQVILCAGPGRNLSSARMFRFCC
jgi:predicted transposase YbfD/YdcC